MSNLLICKRAIQIVSLVILCFYSCKTDKGLTRQIPVSIGQDSPVPIYPGKRLAFGWPAIGIKPGGSVIICPDKKLTENNNWLRLTVAQEIWDEKIIHASIPGSEISLGTMDIRYSSVLVPYELRIDKKFIPGINKKGIKLVLESPTPLWFYSRSPDSPDNLGLMPHILSSPVGTGSVNDFLNCFISLNSIQAFGWREGCVLDGLWQIYIRKGNKKALDAIKTQLALFFDHQNNLIYENCLSFPKDNQIDGIESTIPFATLARIEPNHPVLKKVEKAWLGYQNGQGMVIDGAMISAEGCYTVAYPMTVLGNAWNRDDLKTMAMEQLRHRFVLIDNGNFYLRSTNGQLTYKNWARGAAWVLLGFVRTIEELDQNFQDPRVIKKFKNCVDIALSMQRDDGLWSYFMHDQENSLPDASGSAGIAAAILTGIKLGILPEAYKTHVDKCWASLQEYIAPDGFLRGVAQDNRGGMELQQSNYRVIAQMGMGLMAQLYAVYNN